MKYKKKATPKAWLSRGGTVQEVLSEFVRDELPTIWWDDRPQRKSRAARYDASDRILRLEAAIIQVGIAVVKERALERNGI